MTRRQLLPVSIAHWGPESWQNKEILETRKNLMCGNDKLED